MLLIASCCSSPGSRLGHMCLTLTRYQTLTRPAHSPSKPEAGSLRRRQLSHHDQIGPVHLFFSLLILTCLPLLIYRERKKLFRLWGLSSRTQICPRK